MDQRRMLLGVALSVVMLILYQQFVISRYTRQRPDTGPSPTETAPGAVNEEPAPAPPPPSEPGIAEAAPQDGGEVTVETDVFTARVGLRGGCLRSLQLKKFRRDVAADSGFLELVREGEQVPAFPLVALLGAAGSDAGVLYSTEPRQVSVTGHDEVTLTLRGTGAGGEDLEKQLAFRGDRYDFGVTVSVKGTPTREIGLVMVAPPPLGGGSSRQAPDQAIALTEGHIVERKSADLPKKVGPDDVIRNVTWAGFTAQYFVAIGIPGEHQTTRAELANVEPPKNTSEPLPASQREGNGNQSTSDTPVVRLRSETPDGHASFSVFVGPKSRELLSEAGHDLGRALDFGWFWFIAVPLLEALRLIDRVTGNYGVAIILLTGAVKLVTVPLTRSTFRNMSAMRKLQPQIEAARARHKEDQVAQQREVMELYRRHGLNPLSGCLPMFLQLPVFVGLYNAISHAIELRHAPFLLWITDLSAPDRLVLGGVGVPVLTLLMGASMLVQQWMTPQQGDPAQQKVMMLMPIMFTYMFMGFPSGLVLYWLVNNVLTIGQQYLLLREQK